MTSENKQEIIRGIVLSIFDEDGPTPVFYLPEDMDELARSVIAMKTISLLMGDSIYQNGDQIDGINYFGILPFPDLQYNGLTYFFLIADDQARGQAKAATITLLIDEKNSSFFYTNMKYLRILLDKAAGTIQGSSNYEEHSKTIFSLKEDLIEFTKELKDPFSTKRNLKILFAGLDKAGKSSFLLGVNKKYSEIIKVLPTKGIERSEERLFEEQESQISIWDLGGQKKYREKYLEQSKIYLYNADLIYYLIDIQDERRIEIALELFKNIVETLRQLEEYPPIVVCFNKYDPDLKGMLELDELSDDITEEIQNCTQNFFIKVFKTSIFDHYSLISAYSFGLSQLSPNRELFENQLRILANKTNSSALLLLNEKGIILSNYSTNDELSNKCFEISAPHFQTLYKTFKEFKMLKKDFLVSSGITDESKKIVFKKIKVEKYNLYLLFFIEEQFGIDKIETSVPEFTLNLGDLMKTYI
ncbi:MAG: 50S ribosome-binding GTPase [Candidatus Lokiarchaeota archaeon]|nr:50S ribosome-binding GTPase [Candidatus Lokiarchaeota archaeon]